MYIYVYIICDSIQFRLFLIRPSHRNQFNSTIQLNSTTQFNCTIRIEASEHAATVMIQPDASIPTSLSEPCERYITKVPSLITQVSSLADV